MKPIVIIAISVGCSVVAVLGVLLGLEMYATNEAQKALAIELERQAVCERLYDNSGSLKGIISSKLPPPLAKIIKEASANSFS